MKYLAVEIVDDGRLYAKQALIPDVFSVSHGPMSAYSGLVGTVQALLAELCADLWRDRQAVSAGGERVLPATSKNTDTQIPIPSHE